ncbi:hypothetical protein WJX82_007075 [Trebouxia sp. C0006]
MASYQTEPDTCSGGSWKFAWEREPTTGLVAALQPYNLLGAASDPRAVAAGPTGISARRLKPGVFIYTVKLKPKVATGDVRRVDRSMQGSCGFRHAKRGWQRTQESLGQACRHRHSWLMLLAPCLFIFLLLLWTPSVHPGLSVRIEAHTQKFNESHRAMEMSFVAAQDSTRAADVAADGFTLDIVDGLVDSLAAPAPSFAQDDQSAYSGTADSDSNLQGMIHPTSRVFRAPGKFPVTRDDLVIAMPTDKRHFPIVEASKAWRKEMRTFVALANETVASGYAHFEDSSEVWGYYPDDEPLKGLHPGDSRAALTPFMAHEAFEGDYKWILYGDDDTFFFVDGVLELLQDFDPSLPYFITDHYWWGDELNESMNYHPHERAPRCLPCHWTQEDEERSLRVDGYRPFQPYIGCPCTAERICKTDDRGYFDDACNMPVWKPDTEGRDFRVYTMHGGAGALMSIGLMERLPLSFMDRCMKDLARSSGGDALISVCLWRAGYAFTDPGYSFYHWEAKSFDPGPENSTALLAYLGDAISNNSDQYSLELLTHMATSHLRQPPALLIGVDDFVMTKADSRCQSPPWS